MSLLKKDCIMGEEDNFLDLLKEWKYKISGTVTVIDENDREQEMNFRRWAMKMAMRTDIAEMKEIIRKKNEKN